jgi:small subunit ribosomal protein S20
MPHTASAAKRHRQSEERRLRNKSRTTELKTLKKRLLRAVHDGEADQAKSLYSTLTKRLDQAASGSTLHKNAAARVKSRMAKALSAKPVEKPAAKAPKAAAPKAAKAAKPSAPKA